MSHSLSDQSEMCILVANNYDYLCVLIQLPFLALNPPCFRFLIMEYVSGGELFEYLVNKGRLDEPEALRFFQQIIVGLAFCHKRKVW